MSRRVLRKRYVNRPEAAKYGLTIADVQQPYPPALAA